MKYFCVVIFIFGLGFNSMGQSNQQQIQSMVNQASEMQKTPPEATKKEDMECTDEGDYLSNCTCTKNKALKECISPSGQGFKRAAQFILTLPSVATPFMTGGDSGQMADMCKLSALSGTVANLLNGTQGTNCERAISVCTESCVTKARKYINKLRENEMNAAGESAALVQKAESNYRARVEEVEQINADCNGKAQTQMQMAQQQMQAGLAPMSGMTSCAAGLDEDGSGSSGEIVDCTLARFASYAQCSTVSKANSAGNGVTYDPGVGIAADTDSEMDLPGAEDREDYWNALKNKTSGSGNGSGRSGMGALGSGGGSGGFGALGKGGSGAARKTGSSLLSGGSDSGGAGGGGWGNGGNEGFDKKYAKLGAKGKGLNMLTKKKIGGRQLASDLASSTEDIWTRVYLRTNTNCTKQLLECSANKSLNPYGLQKSR